MYNRNEDVNNCPVDIPYNTNAKEAETEYENGVIQKWETLLWSAELYQIETLIVCDLGCGVFKNDGKLVGNCLREALRRHPKPKWLKKVVLTGSSRFVGGVTENSSNSVFWHW